MLKQGDIDSLDKFQRYAGKRIQRFPRHAPNETCFRGLGWMRIENFIYAKKLIFVRTIMNMKPDSIYRIVFVQRTMHFNNNIAESMENVHDSPVFDILKTSITFGLYDFILNMVTRNHVYTKIQWKRIVWNRAWEIEDEDWQYGALFYKSLNCLNMSIGKTYYLSWWHISDCIPSKMRQCENMAKLVCRISDLKSDDYNLRGASFLNKSCSNCDDAAYEDVGHMIMSCTNTSDLRKDMIGEIENDIECRDIWRDINASEVLSTLLGGTPRGHTFPEMFKIWCIAAFWINEMYYKTLSDRAGVG